MANFECSLRQVPRLHAALARRCEAKDSNGIVTIGQTGKSGGVARIPRDRLLKTLDSLAEFCRAPVPVVAAFKIGLVGFWGDGVRVCEVGVVVGSQFDLDFPRNGLGYFCMKGKNIAQVAVIAL